MDIFKSLNSLVKVGNVTIDNNVFRLHYKVTVVLLLVAAVLVTSKQFFGDPIHCAASGGKGAVDEELIKNYCLVFGTYTVKERLTDDRGVAPGVGTESRNTEAIRHTYYQWVSLIYYLVALCFYIPRYVWKNWEGGRLQFLVDDLKHPLVSSKWDNIMRDKMVDYFIRGKYVHGSYSVKYTVCEILNFANVILQILLLNWFFSGNFSDYGVSFVRWLNQNQEVNPMTEIFPKETKCKFKNFGPSGDIQVYDYLCILSLNILNEKLFLIIWFWFAVLAAVSFMSLVYRFFLYSSRLLRAYIMRSQLRDLGKEQALTIANDLSYGDFFILYQLGKNLNPIIFQELVLAICDRINNKKEPKASTI